MRQTSHEHITSQKRHLPYVLYLPDDYEDGDAHPMILFLHGAGERGTDLRGVKSQGIPKKIEAGDELPFIVIAPQCPEDHLWNEYTDELLGILDHVLDTMKGDRERVYLTGLSMGGFGSWYLASEAPESFAAVVPICGFGHHLLGFPERLKRMAHLPVWAFHGEDDSVVPILAHELMVQAFERYGGLVEWTTYPDVDHDSWTVTYDNPELYEWFLMHRRQPTQ